MGEDGIQQRVLYKSEAQTSIKQCHDGVCGGHFAINSTTHKILSLGYYWPNLFQNVKLHCITCKTCQLYGRRELSHGEFHPIIPIGPFEKWGVDFVRPLPKTQHKNQYLIVATDYLTKWSEAQPVKRATQDVAIEFIYLQVMQIWLSIRADHQSRVALC